MNANQLILVSLLAIAIIGTAYGFLDQPITLRENPANHCLIHGKTMIDGVALKCSLS